MTTDIEARQIRKRVLLWLAKIALLILTAVVVFRVAGVVGVGVAGVVAMTMDNEDLTRWWILGYGKV